ncbi:MAG TPA: glycosyltransferase [Candidatus Omnitrophota bacterium]|nr:glycosyltransferase [Candidatus Omnitrophota bacterium]
MIKNIKSLQILGCLDPRSGGPTYSIKKLAEHLSAASVQADIWTFNYPFRDKKIILENNAKHFIAPDFFLSRRLASWSPWVQSSLEAIANRYDLIHNHGHWLFGNYCARLVASKFRKPLMISPRGMLDPWSFDLKAMKKKVAWGLYERKNLEAATIFHATSHMEAESIRRLGLKQPIAVLPNGVDCNSPFASSEYVKQKKKVLLFLSRIDPKKGLERLFSIWQRQEAKFADWELVIAGDGEDKYLRKLKASARKKGIGARIRWVGFVEQDAKKKLYRNASLFVLPTFSENFGNAIGEALSFNIPIITTSGTPWDDVQKERCGWYVENNEEAIEAALIEALQTSVVNLTEMGKRGRQLIERKYSWFKVADEMAQTYLWILKMRDTPPKCIRFD